MRGRISPMPPRPVSRGSLILYWVAPVAWLISVTLYRHDGRNWPRWAFLGITLATAILYTSRYFRAKRA